MKQEDLVKRKDQCRVAFDWENYDSKLINGRFVIFDKRDIPDKKNLKRKKKRHIIKGKTRF